MTELTMPSSYEQACSEHSWSVPERYNIAADVCDSHPREKPAMVWERYDGATLELNWGELQDLANRAAHLLRDRGVERGDRVAVVLPPTPEAAAVFFGTWKLGAILLSMSVLYGDEGIRHRLEDSAPRVLVTDAANAGPLRSLAGRGDDRDRSREPRGPARRPALRGHLGRRPGPALLHLRHHRHGQGDRPRPPLHPRPRGVRLLPRRPRRRALPRHGRVGLGGGDRPLLGPWRLGATQCVYQREAGFDPARQLDFLSRHEVENVFTTPTAMRAMMAIADAGERYPQRFRIVCSAGEPLNPEAIRWFREQYGVTVLDYYGLTESYPLCANFPFMEVREGSMGRPMPGWDVQILDEDENPVATGERGEICLRARSNPHYPLGYWRLPEASEEAFGGEWFHTKDAATMDADGYVWYAGRADDVIIAAGYRIGPFEVESACIEHPAVPGGRRGRLPRRAARQRRQGVHRPRRGARALRRARRPRSRPSSASASAPTPTRGGSSSPTSCRRP